MTGERFGRLLAVKYAGHRGRNRVWLCRCDCGNETTVEAGMLRYGDTQSCGCLHRDRARDANIKHGGSGGWKGPQPRLYSVWAGMKRRCFNLNDSGYVNYGGRGITVCAEWMSFDPFRKWALSNGYRDDLTIERNDNDGNYTPGNCRWATKSEQNSNSRHCRFLTHKGQTRTIAQWAEVVGMNRDTLRNRLNRGWAIDQALTAPVESKFKRTS